MANSAKPCLICFPQFDLTSREITSTRAPGTQVDVTHAKTSGDSLKVFEGEEPLKGRHILVENYKAILYPSSQDTSLKTPLHNKSTTETRRNTGIKFEYILLKEYFAK